MWIGRKYEHAMGWYQSWQIHCLEWGSLPRKELSEPNTEVSPSRNTGKESPCEIPRIIKKLYETGKVLQFHKLVSISPTLKLLGCLLLTFSSTHTLSWIKEPTFYKHTEWLLCALKIRTIGLLTKHEKSVSKICIFKYQGEIWGDLISFLEILNILKYNLYQMS